MLRLLFFGDLLGDISTTSKLLDQPLEEYDALIFTGDIPNQQMFKDLRMQRVLAGETNLAQLMEGTKPPEGLQRALEEVQDITDVFGRL